MIDSLYIAESGLSSQQKLIDVISNNIANVSTPGFKKSSLNFVDLVYQSAAAGQEGVTTSFDQLSNGAGVKASGNLIDFSVGDLKPTGNPFDIAIQGKGMLEVMLDDGDMAYTRAGRLRLDEDGYLVSTQGNRLAVNIQVPPDGNDLRIDANGQVSVRLGNEVQRTELGQLELVAFISEESLSAIGNSLYKPTDTSGQLLYGHPGELGLGKVVQGVTEVSNVSMTEEMVNLMLAQRGYQLNARIIQISDQLMDTINNLRR